MAFILVQHLDPKHESMLPDLLQRTTTLPVIEITDEIKVEPNHIYVIPSNRVLLASDGVLKLEPRTSAQGEKLRKPIDLFFKSLAEVHLGNSIGIILSGTGNDGTLGLKAIRNAGGITIVQNQ